MKHIERKHDRIQLRSIAFPFDQITQNDLSRCGFALPEQLPLLTSSTSVPRQICGVLFLRVAAHVVELLEAPRLGHLLRRVTLVGCTEEDQPSIGCRTKSAWHGIRLTHDPSDELCVLGITSEARVTARYVLRSVMVSFCILVVFLRSKSPSPLGIADRMRQWLARRRGSFSCKTRRRLC